MYHPIYNACKYGLFRQIGSLIDIHIFARREHDETDNEQTDNEQNDNEQNYNSRNQCDLFWRSAIDGAFNSNDANVIEYLYLRIPEKQSDRLCLCKIDVGQLIIDSNVYSNIMRQFALKYALDNLRETKFKDNVWYNFLERMMERFNYTNDEVFGDIFSRNKPFDYTLSRHMADLTALNNCPLLFKLLIQECDSHEHKGRIECFSHLSCVYGASQYGHIDIIKAIINHDRNWLLVVFNNIMGLMSRLSKNDKYYPRLFDIYKYLNEMLQQTPMHYTIVRRVGGNTNIQLTIFSNACALGLLDTVKTMATYLDTHRQREIIAAGLKRAIIEHQYDIVEFIIDKFGVPRTVRTMINDTRHTYDEESIYMIFVYITDKISLAYGETLYIMNRGIDINNNYTCMIKYEKRKKSVRIYELIDDMLYKCYKLYDKNLSRVIDSYLPYE